MASKTKTHPLNGLHTAGIFSDMTVDGPEIGTLVLVVDRAKNLPNRKTIGKQDPYCAARLGKEAKKTTTDIRGGQTPKWDQELRFTVHDSPDYFQLKVSVFNDDKKTELIGEVWIDLRDIIVSGGGQSDKWHQLACKGKYAGEVRIEITFYDTRPKPEKPVVKAKPPQTAEPEPTPAPAAAGPRGMPKRRPLPSDPVTGKAPPSPVPDAVEIPAKPQYNPTITGYVPTQSPLQQLEYNTPPLPAPAGPSGRYAETADPYDGRSPSGEFGPPTRRAEMSGQQYRAPDRPDQYQAHPDERGYSPHYQQSSHDRYDARPQEAFDMPHHDPHRARSFEEDRPPPPPAHRSRTGSNPSMNSTYQTGPAAMRQDVLRNEAHRQSASAAYPGRPTYKAYDSAPAAPASSLYSNAEQPSPPRHYSYDAGYDPGYRSMQATVEDVPESPDSIHGSWGRRRSFAPQSQPLPKFEPEYDQSASPAPLSLSGRREAPPARYSNAPNTPEQHRRHESNGYAPSPTNGYASSPTMMLPREVSSQAMVPRHLGRHSETSLASSYVSHPDQRSPVYRNEMDTVPSSYELPHVPASLVPGIDPGIAQEISDRFHQDRNHQRRYTQPPPMDTPPRGRSTGEIVPRGYDHNSPSGPYNSGPPPQSRSQGQLVYNGPSTSSVNVVIKQRNYSPNPPRDPSPNPRHTIRRKSVSPAPAPAPEPRRLSGVPFGPDSYDALNPSAATSAVRDAAEARPDYDEATGKIITHDGREVDPSDHLPMESWAPEPEPKKPSASAASRPSPSVPQTSLPSSRASRLATRPQSMLPSSGPRYSDMHDPATPSPPVSTGRNRLQKKPHRASVAAPPTMSGAPPPFMSGANGSTFSRAGDVGSSPLAPLPPHQDNFTPPRQPARASTFDYAGGSENHSPGYHGSGFSPGGHGGSRSPMAPSIPAKVPLALPPPQSYPTSGALQLHSSSLAGRGDLDRWDYDERGGHGGHGSHGDSWGGASPSALEEELSRIDIGTGRSRRRGY